MLTIPSRLRIIAVLLASAFLVASLRAESPATQPVTRPAQPQWDASKDPTYQAWRRKQYDASEDEWKIIEPRVLKVQSLQRELQSGFSPIKVDPNKPKDPAVKPVGFSTIERNAVGKASEELRAILNDKDATPDEIKAKAAALQKARAEMQKELKKAQEDLREVLSVRQEALMITYSLLD